MRFSWWLIVTLALWSGGCGAPAPSEPNTTPTTASASPATATPLLTTAIQSEALLVTLTSDPTHPAPTVTPGEDATVTVTAIVTTTPLTVTITTGSWERTLDGGLLIRDDGGTPLGGIGPPTTEHGDVTTAVTQPHTATIEAAPLDSLPVLVTMTLGSRAVSSAHWGRYDGGRSLAVDLTSWARTTGSVGAVTGWAQLIAQEPSIDTPGLYDQYQCHALGAPNKDTWNLEPWRPTVGLLDTVAARCNPR